MKKETRILSNLTNYLANNGFCHIEFDDEHNIIFVCIYASIVLEQRNKEIALAFEVNAAPTFAANLTIQVIQFALKNSLQVGVYEPYATIFDEESETVVETLFGQDALNYFETGELPVNMKIVEDEDKKLDNILEQISKKGEESLNDEQRKFLNKMSNKK